MINQERKEEKGREREEGGKREGKGRKKEKKGTNRKKGQTQTRALQNTVHWRKQGEERTGAETQSSVMHVIQTIRLRKNHVITKKQQNMLL